MNRYADCPLPGGTVKIDRRRSIEGEKGKKKKKKKKKRRKKKKMRRRKKYLASSSPASLSPASRHCPRLRVIFRPHEETFHLPVWGERSRR
ncbi:hypothetical protein B296_00012840, partial [Ensete ventricosum]